MTANNPQTEVPASQTEAEAAAAAPKTLTFGETGINDIDDTDRAAVKAGQSFAISHIKLVPSAKYGKIAHLTAWIEDMEVQMYSASKVLVEQCDKIAQKYGTESGDLSQNIFVTVEAVTSQTSGMDYLRFT